MTNQLPTMTIVVPPELFEKVQDFRFVERIESKSEAMRKLVELGLRCYEQGKSNTSECCQQALKDTLGW